MRDTDARSIWLADDPIPSREPLSGEIRTDVLVIGGGMAGLLTAWLLQQKGVSTVLVEKERICHGSRSSSLGKVLEDPANGDLKQQ